MSYILNKIENFNVSKSNGYPYKIHSFLLKNLTPEHIKFSIDCKRIEVLTELNSRLLYSLNIHENDKATIISVPYTYEEIKDNNIFEYCGLDNKSLIWGFQEENGILKAFIRIVKVIKYPHNLLIMEE